MNLERNLFDGKWRLLLPATIVYDYFLTLVNEYELFSGNWIQNIRRKSRRPIIWHQNHLSILPPAYDTYLVAPNTSSILSEKTFGSNIPSNHINSSRAVLQLKVELQFAIKFSYFREFWKSTKVQFIGQKLNFNFCPTHGLTFLSCNSNEVQRERSGPL